MKITTTLLLFAVSVLTMFAQDKVVYFEIGGPANGASLSFDSRIKPNSPWGYRVGLGYSGEIRRGIGGDLDKHNITAHLEGNRLWGKGNHHFEAGVGLSLGRYYLKWQGAITYATPTPAPYYTNTSFGYFFYGTAGYRYQRPRGLMFRAGITPTLNPGGNYGVGHKPFIIPYVGVGYSF